MADLSVGLRRTKAPAGPLGRVFPIGAELLPPGGHPISARPASMQFNEHPGR